MTTGEDVDRNLLRRAQAGDPEAFDQLVDQLTPRLYRVVRRLAPDDAEAEAIVQEAWLRAWRHRRNLDPDRPALAWLSRIAVNVARDQWRKHRPLDFADVGEGADIQMDETAAPEARLEEAEARRRLAQAVLRLRPEWQVVIALRYDGSLAYSEIADVLSVPVNTVRTHLHRAHAALRRSLGEGNDA